jgi:hypothetical protein
MRPRQHGLTRAEIRRGERTHNKKGKTPMATEAQQKFFQNLTEQREFPAGSDTTALREQFAGLDDGSASKWIEAALELPERGEVAPPWVAQSTPTQPVTPGAQPPSAAGAGSGTVG